MVGHRVVRAGGRNRLGDIAWFTLAGEEITREEMTGDDWDAWFAKSLTVFLNGRAISEPDRRGERIQDDSFLASIVRSDTISSARCGGTSQTLIKLRSEQAIFRRRRFFRGRLIPLERSRTTLGHPRPAPPAHPLFGGYEMYRQPRPALRQRLFQHKLHNLGGPNCNASTAPAWDKAWKRVCRSSI